jgi:hypothetical protein
VFLADGGGGGTSAPSYTGTQTLQIEPSAIPGALKAFQTAHDRVSRKVDELGGIDIRPWAHDEVSEQTAQQFAERSFSGGASALEVLTGYRDQLAQARDSLQRAFDDYTAMEGDNSARWGIYD